MSGLALVMLPYPVPETNYYRLQTNPGTSLKLYLVLPKLPGSPFVPSAAKGMLQPRQNKIDCIVLCRCCSMTVQAYQCWHCLEWCCCNHPVAPEWSSDSGKFVCKSRWVIINATTVNGPGLAGAISGRIQMLRPHPWLELAGLPTRTVLSRMYCPFLQSFLKTQWLRDGNWLACRDHHLEIYTYIPIT